MIISILQILRGMVLIVLYCCFATIDTRPVYAQMVDVSAKVAIHGGSRAPKRTPVVPDVVVWLSPLQPMESKLQPRAPFRLLQKNKQFTPHLLVVPTGSSVEFPNEDPFFHNVFSLFNGKRFDLGLYESGASRSVKFDQEGVSYIFCNIHPEMGAVVLVLSTPFYAISDSNGEVVIHDVPPGIYRLHVWSERARVKSQNIPREVQISTSVANLGEIDIEVATSPLATHKNKFGEEYKNSRTVY